MKESIRVFVNERPVVVGRGSCVLDAVAALDPDLAASVDAGAARVTDGVGRVIEALALLEQGAILRVVGVRPGRPSSGESP